ncbi:MAG: transcriptional regulator, partial [Tannerellaceae bacterium]|nr:transcriptional regulator [Tannerellaceae bacterium]
MDTSNGNVQVMLFRNRLEVWNPGTLPYGLTPEKLLQPHPSVPANPILANPIYLAGYIERMGTGTRDIVNKCRAIGLKDPEFIQEEDFKVILWRKESEDEPIKSIIGLILNRPGINRSELVENSGKGFATVKRYLKILKDNNLIEYKGSKKTGGYYLTDEAKEKL